MITSDRISELASTLAGNGTVTEPIQLTAMKYWFDPQWTDPLLTDDFILADLPLTGVVQLHWSATEKSISCDLVSLATVETLPRGSHGSVTTVTATLVRWT